MCAIADKRACVPGCDCVLVCCACLVPCARSSVPNGVQVDIELYYMVCPNSGWVLTVKAIILTGRIYNDFLKLTGLCVPKVTILTHSQRSIATALYRFLYNNFYFNDRFLLVRISTLL